MQVIDSFKGPYRFLSNFWPAYVTYEGLVYPTVENAYQAAKTTVAEFRKALQHCTAGESKRIGRQVPMRPDWDAIKVDVMRELLRQKFRDPELAEWLLGTDDDELVEGNTWGDYFWGVCNGEGQNNLGKLLMEVRSEIR